MIGEVYSKQEAQLEARIEAAYQRLITAHDRGGRLEAAVSMRFLIAQRSPERVAAMERARGLV